MSKEGQGEATPASQVNLTKRIVSFEEGNPTEEPLFINYAHVAYAGGSAYIDVGVIPLEELAPETQEATFLVLTRLVMSKETIVALNRQINELLSHESQR
jgi:hypothetical protein